MGWSMRCARCDRIVIHQVLGRQSDGGLVFGWCEECLVETGCERIDPPTSHYLSHMIPVSRVRIRRHGGSRGVWKSLALAWLGGAGLLAAWGLILAYVGGWKLSSPIPRMGQAGNPLGSSSAAMLIGSAVLALLSLIGWSLVLGKGGNRRFLFRSIQLGSALTAFATLAWGILRHDPHRDPVIVAVVALCLTVSFTVRQFEKHDGGRQKLVTMFRETVRQHGRIR